MLHIRLISLRLPIDRRLPEPSRSRCPSFEFWCHCVTIIGHAALFGRRVCEDTASPKTAKQWHKSQIMKFHNDPAGLGRFK